MACWPIPDPVCLRVQREPRDLDPLRHCDKPTAPELVIHVSQRPYLPEDKAVMFATFIATKGLFVAMNLVQFSPEGRPPAGREARVGVVAALGPGIQELSWLFPK